MSTDVRHAATGPAMGCPADFHERVGRVIAEVETWSPDRRASRQVIEQLGAAGVIAIRWSRHDDVCGVELIHEIARRGLSSTAVAVSLHVESVLAMLRQFAPPDLQTIRSAALAGTAVGCVAASEPGGGSDLASVATTATPARDGGWRIVGEKKFVTLATQADFTIVLARSEGGGRPAGRLGAFVVPREGYEVLRTHRLVAGSDLDTSWIRLDATVPAHNLLGRPGLGLAVVNWGLTKERLAIAALVVGTCRLALSLAITHATERRQFGRRLFDHQAIRLRLADLHARLDALDAELRHLMVNPAQTRRIAGLKVVAARFGERCVSECMHVFGGDGYVEGATPLGRLWRDIRLARLGGGTDEMMLEIVAGGLAPDIHDYLDHVPEGWRRADE